MKINVIKSYLFSGVTVLVYCLLLFFILKNNYPDFSKKLTLSEVTKLKNEKNETKLIEMIKEDKDWMSIIHNRSRIEGIDVEKILKNDCQFIFEHGLNHYWVDYYINRIKNDSNWLNDIKKSSIEKNISLDSNIVSAAKYMASKKVID